MRAAGPPFRKGMPGKVSPPQPFLIQWAGLLFHQSAPRATNTKFLRRPTVIPTSAPSAGLTATLFRKTKAARE